MSEMIRWALAALAVGIFVYVIARDDTPLCRSRFVVSCAEHRPVADCQRDALVVCP